MIPGKIVTYASFHILRTSKSMSPRPGLLKLWVATHKWVPEPSHVGRENASCKNNIMVITSVSLPTNVTLPFLLTLTSDFFKIMRSSLLLVTSAALSSEDELTLIELSF